MFHFENEKIENTEKPQEYKKEGDSGWLNIPFKEKGMENDSIGKEFEGVKDGPWVKIPHEEREKDHKDDSWLNIPINYSGVNRVIENKTNDRLINSDIINLANKNTENKAPEEDKSEKDEYKGGSYGELKNKGHGDYSNPPQEVHHMPADVVSPLERNDGPAIAMDKEDHRKTASCGNTREAREYREKQRKLIAEGKFEEAMQMDIDDIHEKFGDKYDDAIAEMKAYYEKIKEEKNV